METPPNNSPLNAPSEATPDVSSQEKQSEEDASSASSAAFAQERDMWLERFQAQPDDAPLKPLLDELLAQGEQLAVTVLCALVFAPEEPRHPALAPLSARHPQHHVLRDQLGFFPPELVLQKLLDRLDIQEGALSERVSALWEKLTSEPRRLRFPIPAFLEDLAFVGAPSLLPLFLRLVEEPDAIACLDKDRPWTLEHFPTEVFHGALGALRHLATDPACAGQKDEVVALLRRLLAVHAHRFIHGETQQLSHVAGLCRTLGQWRATEALPELLQLCAFEEHLDAFVARVPAALAQEVRERARVLKKEKARQLRDLQRELHSTILKAIEEIGLDEEAMEALVRLCQEGKLSGRAVEVATRLIIQQGDHPAISDAQLLSLLRSRCKRTRHRAMAVIGRRLEGASPERLEGFLKGANLRQSALEQTLLQRIGRLGSKEELLQRLQDTRFAHAPGHIKRHRSAVHYRVGAVQGLRQESGAESAKALVSAISSEERALWRASRQSLLKLGTPAIEPLFEALAAAPDFDPPALPRRLTDWSSELAPTSSEEQKLERLGHTLGRLLFAQGSPSERFAHVRHVLSLPAHQGTWAALCALLTGNNTSDEWQQVIAYADGHLQSWPDALRKVPNAWWDWKRESSNPTKPWSLIRHVDLQGPAYLRLQNVHNRHVSQPRLAAGFVRKLLASDAMRTCTQLLLIHTEIYDDGLQLLLADENIRHLRLLSLEGNRLTAKGGEAIAKNAAFSRLQALCLKRNGIGQDEAVRASIQQALPESTILY